MKDNKGKWITLPNGIHVFIADGETLKHSLEKLSIADLKKASSVELTKRDFARYYEKLGEIQKGGYFRKTAKGLIVMTLHKMKDSDIPKIIITTGNFIKPKIKQVIEFYDDSSLFYLMEILKW